MTLRKEASAQCIDLKALHWRPRIVAPTELCQTLDLTSDTNMLIHGFFCCFQLTFWAWWLPTSACTWWSQPSLPFSTWYPSPSHRSSWWPGSGETCRPCGRGTSLHNRWDNYIALLSCGLSSNAFEIRPAEPALLGFWSGLVIIVRVSRLCGWYSNQNSPIW